MAFLLGVHAYCWTATFSQAHAGMRECIAGERFCVFGTEGSGNSELLEIVMGMSLPSSGTSTVLGIDSSRLFDGVTLGSDDPQRDTVRGMYFHWQIMWRVFLKLWPLFLSRSVGLWYKSQVILLWGLLRFQFRFVFFAASIGYCSALNATHQNLSVIENLMHYAVLKSLPMTCIDEQLQRFGLLSQKERKASELDQSSQRLLSLAIASLGSPRVLIIDSPSAGMSACRVCSCLV